MAAPFYNAIKGTTAGTPGTGAFTPNAAATGYRAWSNVPTGVFFVRYDDGSSWELSFSYWNGTTLSRAASQLFDSSSGSAISLTSAATAALVVAAHDVGPAFGETSSKFGSASANGGWSAPTLGSGILATSAAHSPATTNYLTEQSARKSTSVTTANGQGGFDGGAAGIAYSSSSAGRGGWEFTQNFGAATLPTSPRAFIGMTSATFFGQTIEPSAFVGNYATIGLDSTDTNFQLLTNNGTGGGTKADTGIPWAANGWYRVKLWAEPGSTKVWCLLIRVDTGAIWYGSTTTDVPSATMMFPQLIAGLNGTNTGTAIVIHVGHNCLFNGS